MTTIEKSQQDFLAHCRYEKNLSPKTLKAYETDLRQFIEFLNKQNYSSEVSLINKIVIRDYLQTIAPAKPKTIKRKIATVKALFNFLEYEDRILVNPFRKMRIQIKEAKNLPNVMNIREVEQILSSGYNDKNAEQNTLSYAYAETIRSIAVLELLFATGVRVSELSHLKGENIDLQTGQIKVKGKGNKERMVQVCNKEAIKALKEYYKLFMGRMANCGGYFFVNRFGHRLSEQSVRFLVKKHAKAAGLERRITPHSFRHSFATLLLEQDVDIKYIQHLLGHSSIMTTQIYTHVNSEKQKQILQNHPRGNFHIKRKSMPTAI